MGVVLYVFVAIILKLCTLSRLKLVLSVIMVLLVFQRTSMPTYWSFIVIVFWTINVIYLWHISQGGLYGLPCKQVACSVQRNKCRSRKINEIISYSVVFISQIAYLCYYTGQLTVSTIKIVYYEIHVRPILISSIYYTSIQYRLRTIVYDCALSIIDVVVTRQRFYLKFRLRLCLFIALSARTKRRAAVRIHKGESSKIFFFRKLYRIYEKFANHFRCKWPCAYYDGENGTL